MTHIGTRIIKTQRLLLRRFEVSDADAMFRNWANDPEVTKYLSWPPHGSVDVTTSLLEDWVASYGRDDFYQWAIVPDTFGEPVGGISVIMRNDETNMVHIGYCIGRRWWKQGITSEAFAAVIEYFFGAGVNRIESRHDPRNPNSGKVMLKCGLKYEGTMRQADKNNQGICDAAYYGLTADDYFNRGGA